jgi:uncharacterized protein DUF4026/uncharacterized protein DUF2314
MTREQTRGGFRPRKPSTLVGYLPGDVSPPSASELAERLEAAGLAVDSRRGDATRALRARTPASGTTPERVYELTVQPLPPGAHPDLGFARLTQPQYAAMRASRFGVVVRTRFAGEPLAAFHAQLQVLAAAAPELVGLEDVDGWAVRPGAWVLAAAATEVPPVPTSLFTIHVVDGGGQLWFHTHGLRRCGTVELEALRVRREDGAHVGGLLNTVASLFVEWGLPPAGEPFLVGEDVELGWLPWRFALVALRGVEAGTLADRDEAHRAPSAVLVVPARARGQRWTDVGAVVLALAGDPLPSRSPMETERAALLARERLPAFRALHARLGEREGHRFLVKLGWPVDGATDGTREHLWFEVHAFAGDRVDATCVNAPYAVSSLAEGRRGWFPLEPLSDFSLVTPAGEYGPDTVALLDVPPPRAEVLS